MDTDIASVKDTFELQKIKAQDERDNRKVMQEIARQQADLNLTTANDIKVEDANAKENFRREVLLALAQKYMTTGTATVAATVLEDAAKDAARLAAAVDAVMALY